jgi:hypothetical protein
MDHSIELHAKELCLERTTATKEDLQWQNSRLVKKREGNMTYPQLPDSILSPLTLCVF